MTIVDALAGSNQAYAAATSVPCVLVNSTQSKEASKVSICLKQQHQRLRCNSKELVKRVSCFALDVC